MYMVMYLENIEFDWNKEKDLLLKQERWISFDEVVERISEYGILDFVPHSNQEKYPHQRRIVFVYKEYIYYIPCVMRWTALFLKTIIPGRKLKKEYWI